MEPPAADLWNGPATLLIEWKWRRVGGEAAPYGNACGRVVAFLAEISSNLDSSGLDMSIGATIDVIGAL